MQSLKNEIVSTIEERRMDFHGWKIPDGAKTWKQEKMDSMKKPSINIKDVWSQNRSGNIARRVSMNINMVAPAMQPGA